MTTDRGGLNYPIETSAKLQPLEDFRAGVAAAREEMRLLRAEVAGFNRDSAAAKQGMRDAATAAKSAAASAKDAAAATREAAEAERQRQKVTTDSGRALTIRELAERKYAKAIKDAAVERAFANISEEQGFFLQKRAITQAQAQADATKKITAVLSQRQKIEAILADIKARNLELTDAELSKLGVLTASQRALAQAKERLAKAQNLANDAQLRGLRIQESVLSRKTSAADNAEITRQLFLQGLDAQGRPLPPTQLTVGGKIPGAPPSPATAPQAPPTSTFKTIFQQALGIQAATNSTVDSGNRLVFTFRRLVGIFAVFTLIRKGVQGFSDLVKGAIEFNSQIESAQLGIAGILSAVGNVRDATGQAVNAAQEFVLAQKEAARQVALLRRDALSTTTTFEQLVETFQVALAPGLQAGLNTDQIRKFAVAISQAATSIGLSQRQLSEEIRSILAGTINPRNTRVATALGITNADINRAKQLGTLAEFLTNKFKAFTQVGAALGSTFEGSLNRAKTAFQLVTGEASLGFFNELKSLLQQIFKLIVQATDKTDSLEPKPAVLEGFKAIFASLQAVVKLIRDGISNFDANAFKALATTIGKIAEVVGAVLVGAVEGIAGGLKIISAILSPIFGLIQSIAGVDLSTLTSAIAFIAKSLVVFAALRFTVQALVVTWRTLTIAVQVARIALIAFDAVLVGTRTLMSAVSISAKALRLAIASTGIGLLVVALGVLVATLADKFGLFDSLFGGLQAKSNNLEEALRRTFSELPAQIATAAESLKDFDKKLEDAFDSAEKLRKERSLLFAVTGPRELATLSDVGLSGDTAEAVKAAISSAVDFSTQLKQINKERKADESKIVGFQQQQVRVEADLLKLLNSDHERLKAAFEVKAKLLALSQQENESVAELNRLRNTQTDDPAEQEKINALIKTHEVRLHNIVIDQAFYVSQLSDNADKQLKIVDLLGKHIGLDGQIKVAQEEISQLDQGKIELERAVNRELNERLILQARQNILQSSFELSAKRAEDIALRLKVANAKQSPAQQALAEAQGTLLILQQQLHVEEQKRQIQRDELATLIQTRQAEVARAKTAVDSVQPGDEQGQITAARQLEAAELAVTLLRERQVQLREEDIIATQDLNLQIQDQQRILEEAQTRAATGPEAVIGQVQLALQELANQLPSQFDVLLNTLREGIQGFSDFISSSIVDAFDPTKKVDLKERFAEFLRGLASQIISTLVQIAVTRTLLGLAGLFPVGGFAQGGQVQGMVHGGRARSPRQHRHRIGFAEGGQVDGQFALANAPAGMDARDRVPVMTRVGEWFFPPDSPYRNAFPAMLQGLVDPLALDSLAGIKNRAGRTATLARGPQGFAEGGQVARQAAAASAAAPAPQGAAGPLPAFVVANDAAAERLLKGGRSAFVRFMDEEGFQRR